ncbi:MAG: TlpA disulfide reductase family protein [Candidatus Krumholzibacteriia bacterium]
MTSRLTCLLLLLALALAGCAGSHGKVPSVEDATLTAVGDPAPSLTVTTMAGEVFDLAAQRGKVVLISFWATWCPPCREEMPHLRDEVWRRWQDRDDFVLISVAREETPEVVAPFLAKFDFDWTFATDPTRENYARFAEAHIPRNYVIGRDGRIVFQSVGYTAEEFAAMVGAVEGALR